MRLYQFIAIFPHRPQAKLYSGWQKKAAQHICSYWNSASRAISIVFLQNGARNILWEAIKAEAQGRVSSASKAICLSKFHFNIFGEDIKFKTRCKEQTYPKFMRLHLTSSYQLIPTLKYASSWQRENMFFYNFSVSPEVQMDHGSGSNNI